MEQQELLKLIKICDQVSEETENDTKRFEGQPFNGKVVAEYFGCMGAGVNALAVVLKKILEDKLTIQTQNGTDTTSNK